MLAAACCAAALSSASAFAANGNANGNGADGPPAAETSAPGNGNGNSGNGLGNGGGNGTSGDGGNSANAHAAVDQKQPSNMSVTARVDQPGASDGTAQSNNAKAAADAAAVNNDGPAQATADAAATQEDPSNVNLSARVNSQGDDGATTQTNAADAAANAAAAGAPGSQAQAGADVSQQAPLNVNVAVRVNSPGDQGPVTQANTATANAGDAPSSPVVGPQAAGEGNTASVDNSAALDQSLEQCGTTCATGSTGAAQQAAAPAGAQTVPETSATATQQSPTNVNVSVRVASPGNDAAVSQSNDASANAGQAVASSTDSSNVNVQVTVDGDTVSPTASSNGQPWTWNWNWDLGAAPTAAPTAANDWNWNWTDPSAPSASSTQPTVAPTPVDGHWIWIFDYTAPDGTKVTVTVDQTCACAWVWSWTWTGAPPATPAPSAAPASSAQPQVVQRNDAVASAAAAAGANVAQQMSQEAPNAGSQSAAQQLDVMQTADAEAAVTQSGATNSSVVTGGELDGLTQWNLAEATSVASASLSARQTISQTLQLAAGDTATHSEIAAQQITIIQSAAAHSHAIQAGAHNRNRVAAHSRSRAPIGAITQSNEARAEAFAISTATVQQQVAQHQLGEGADQLASADQSATILQVAEANADVAQANLVNTSDVVIPLAGLFNPPLEQSNDAHAFAQMSNDARVEQDISQTENGAFVTWVATAEQNASIVQSGDASASAAQAGIENVAHWRGPIGGDGGALSEAQAEASTTPVAGIAEPTISGIDLPAEGSTPLSTPPVRALPHQRHNQAASSRLQGRSQPLLPAPAVRGRPIRTISALAAQATVAAGSCAPFCREGFSSGLGFGPAAAPSGAWYALQPRSHKPAAPGVGRLLDDAPALGQPVDTAPLERPG
ncbi:MAG TPA: hypothetical protein VLB89_02265 [Gaiellaceae bacterium]|nr:hypothetical protein [Gaiellaceae bacterium]